MRNGNIVVAIGVLAVALLAAEGKLKELWDAVMSAAGPTAASSSPGVSSPPGAAGGPKALAPFAPLDPAPTPAFAYPSDKKGPQNVNVTRFPSTPGMPGYDAVQRVFSMWPAGDQEGWQAFQTCYVTSGGNIADCAARGFVKSTQGVG